MPTYRTKSAVYDAVQYTGDDAQAEELTESMVTNVSAELSIIPGSSPPETEWTGNLQVETSDGTFQVCAPTDYILTDTDDLSRFVVSAADFAANYEEIPI